MLYICSVINCKALLTWDAHEEEKSILKNLDKKKNFTNHLNL